jgi:hypothetical protein
MLRGQGPAGGFDHLLELPGVMWAFGRYTPCFAMSLGGSFR